MTLPFLKETRPLAVENVPHWGCVWWIVSLRAIQFSLAPIFRANWEKVEGYYFFYSLLGVGKWLGGSQVALVVKEPSRQCRRGKRLGFSPWVGKILWRRACQPTPAFLPGESHGQRSLAGDSPWGRRVGHDVVIKQQQQNNRRVSLIILTILMCTIQWH